MRGVEGMIRLQKWNLDEKRRELVELEEMRDDLQAKVRALEEEVIREQKTAAKSVVVSLYGSYARAVIDRRDVLEKSICEMEPVIEAKKDEVAIAFQELKKFEIARDRAAQRTRYEAARKEQILLDDMATDMYRRSKQAG